MNKFAAMGWFKHSELDDWEKGCIGPGYVNGGHDTFTGATVDELIRQCADFAGQPDLQNCLLDSCEEAGRLDIQVYENEQGVAADIAEMDEWRAGKLRLWLATYTFQILRTEKFVLSRNVADKNLYAAA